MRIAFFSSKPYDEQFFRRFNESYNFELSFFESHLDLSTAKLAEACEAVCVFVNDTLDASVLEAIHDLKVKYVLLRCAGFNNVDLKYAKKVGIQVARVPAYSPYAVAEHALALIMALNRKTHRAHNRVREGNFSLDGLLGFDLFGKTIGIVGTGKIGQVFAGIANGLGCKVLAHDPYPNENLKKQNVEYVPLEQIWKQSDIISLHCPLTPQTHHLVDYESITKMKEGVMIINTSRGALIHAKALIKGLKNGHLGAVGLDVYEEEADLFFEDLSAQVIQDDIFARLTTFPNVMITGHQAFFTSNALENIANTTLQNLKDLQTAGKCQNIVK